MREACDTSLILFFILWECEGRSGIFGLKLLAIKARISLFENSCISGESAPLRSLTFTMSRHSVAFLSFLRVATSLSIFESQ